MTVKHATPATVEELAAMSSNTNMLYFGIGTVEGDDLLRFTAANLSAGESLVAIDGGAGCLAEMELPERTPAIGAWCSIGALIGYEYDSQGVAELMEEARRFVSWHQ
ncbi:MAG TPA: hypothetical protein VF175_02295 [Lacipirellula sp.]